MAVVDSSAIIPFLRAGRLSIFKQLWSKIKVPSGVSKEITETRQGANIFFEATADWVSVLEVEEKEANKIALKEGLTPVDAEVLLLAIKEQSPLVAGDRRLIQAAKAYGIKTYWTTEVLLEAVKQKKLSKKEAQLALDELIQNGLRISVEVYAALRNTIEKS